jgi:ABC-type polysaccharide/polyol phosphate export permease
MSPTPSATDLVRWSPRLVGSLRDLHRDRRVATALASRVLKARYKRTFLGVAWALLAPLAYSVVFIIVFDRVANVETRGIPYPIFVYSALVPWSFFSASFNDGAQSILNNTALVNRLPVSRMSFPLASLLVAFVDMLIAAALLPLLMIVFGAAPTLTTIWVPVLFLVQAVLTAGVVLIFAATAPYLRDIRHALPLIAQSLLLVTPVAYGFWAITSNYRTLVSFINPLAPVIDGYRRVIFLGESPEWATFFPAFASSTAVFIAGVLVFDRLQRGFADVA